MNKKRFGLVVLFCLCVCSVDVGRGIFTISDYEAEKVRESILDEIDELGEHEWAGVYFFGNWHDSVSLYIAPEAGYLFESRGDLGFSRYCFGKVTEIEGKIRLSLIFENPSEDDSLTDIELYAVCWGDRKYFISTGMMIEFCNDVNSKREPRTKTRGHHLLRRGDERKEAAGGPDVPKEFKKYLLKKPINAEVIDVGKTITHKFAENVERKETSVTLNAGKDCGLLAGMQLHGVDRYQVFETVTITEVYDETSKGVIQQIFESRPGPECGWKFSTSPTWAEAVDGGEEK